MLLLLLGSYVLSLIVVYSSEKFAALDLSMFMIGSVGE